MHFCMRLNQLMKHFCHSDWGIQKNMHSERINRFFRCRKTLTSSFYVRCHSVPSWDYTTDDSSNRCFECSKMLLYEPMCERSHCRGDEWSVFGGWYSWFLGRQLANKWLCTTQNWLFCVVLAVRLQRVQFFRKKQEIICLEVLRVRATFIGLGSSWNTHTVDCCLLSVSYA